MKRGILTILLISLLLISIILAEQNPYPQELEELDKIQDISNIVTNEAQRESLIERIQHTLIENKIISKLNSVLTSISSIFLILFANNYSFSLFFLLITIIWFYLFFKFSEIINNFTPFSNITSIILGLLITILTAHLGIINLITNFIIWFITSKDAFWYQITALIGTIIILFLIYYITSKLSKGYKENKKKSEEELDRAKLKAGANLAEKLTH